MNHSISLLKKSEIRNTKSLLDIISGVCYVCRVMKTIIDQARREFIAKYLGDISKTIFAVGLASKLFFEFPTWLRITLIMASVTLFIIALFIQPPKEGGPK